MRRSIAAVLVVTALAVLGACGGGDDDGDTSSAAPTSTTPSGFTGKDSEEACKEARAYTAKIRSVGANITNAAQLQTVLSELEEAVSKAAKDAPAEIKPDLENLLSAYKQIAGNIETNPQALAALASDPKLQTSLSRVLKYGAEVCGITP